MREKSRKREKSRVNKARPCNALQPPPAPPCAFAAKRQGLGWVHTSRRGRVCGGKAAKPDMEGGGGRLETVFEGVVVASLKDRARQLHGLQDSVTQSSS